MLSSLIVFLLTSSFLLFSYIFLLLYLVGRFVTVEELLLRATCTPLYPGALFTLTRISIFSYQSKHQPFSLYSVCSVLIVAVFLSKLLYCLIATCKGSLFKLIDEHFVLLEQIEK